MKVLFHEVQDLHYEFSQDMATLIEAVQEGNNGAVLHHLERGADPNECTRLGLSSLHLAAVHDEVGSIQKVGIGNYDFHVFLIP